MATYLYVRCYIDPSMDKPPSFVSKRIKALNEGIAYHKGLCLSPELDRQLFHGQYMNDYVIKLNKGE